MHPMHVDGHIMFITIHGGQTMRGTSIMDDVMYSSSNRHMSTIAHGLITRLGLVK